MNLIARLNLKLASILIKRICRRYSLLRLLRTVSGLSLSPLQIFQSRYCGEAVRPRSSSSSLPLLVSVLLLSYSSGMKGGFYGLRGKQFSLILIALVCTTIITWAWEKTPLLSSLLPPQSRLLQLSPEILMGAPVISSTPSNPDRYVNEDVSAREEKEAVNEQEELHLDAAAPIGRTESSPEMSEPGSNLKETPVFKKEVLVVTEEEKSEHKQINGGTSSKLVNQSLDLAAPLGSANAIASMMEEDHKNLTTLKEKQACNYAKGKWVVDDSRPLYSGFGCKRWLSQMWACRLTQRTDFLYEKLRWQSKDCEMEEFKRTKFFERMQDKTLAIIGDSLGRQQFQSLMCMVTGGEDMPDVQDVGWEFGLVKAPGHIRPDGWAYRFPSTNTTILYYWSASLCDLEPIDINNPVTDIAMHLDRPPAFLRRFIHKFDVLVLNTGHHWNRGKINQNRWVMHVGGVPKNKDIGSAKNLAVHSIAKWVDSQLPRYPGLQAFYRTISPRHFVNGDWNTGGSCNITTPMSVGKELLQEESSDHAAAEAVKGTGVNLLDITGPSQLRDEGHISRFSIKGTPGIQDCLHWCLPGVPDTWNEMLFAQISSNVAAAQ